MSSNALNAQQKYLYKVYEQKFSCIIDIAMLGDLCWMSPMNFCAFGFINVVNSFTYMSENERNTVRFIGGRLFDQSNDTGTVRYPVQV